MGRVVAAQRTQVEVAAVSLARSQGAAKPNEDRVECYVADGEPDAWADFAGIVADGVGASQNPAAASQTATETWLQFLERRFSERPQDLPGFDDAHLSQLLRECFVQAHRQVQRNAPGGSATAAGACVQGNWLLVATVGDSRAYLFSGGRLEQITPDQIDASGNPTEVLGGRVAAPTAEGYASARLLPGDWVLLCSDGLGKVYTQAELAVVLTDAASAEDAARTLKAEAISRGTPDDLTVLLARIVQVGAPFWGEPGSEFGVRGSELGVQGSEAEWEGEKGHYEDKKSSTSTAQRSRPAPPNPEPRTPNSQTGGATMRTTSEGAAADLERRLERLERSPAGGGLSQQEQARLEREFGRLEQQIQELQTRPAETNRPFSGWIPGVLALGLLVGWFGNPLVSRWTGGTKPNAGVKSPGASSRVSPVMLKIQMPKDATRLIGEQLTQTALVLRYQSNDGGRKVVVFPYDGEGKPSVIYRLPKTDDLPTKPG